jgi:hypothetical protein
MMDRKGVTKRVDRDVDTSTSRVLDRLPDFFRRESASVNRYRRPLVTGFGEFVVESINR